MTQFPKIAVIFHRFGPYHLARMKAIARRCSVLAIEEVARSSEYAWDVLTDTNESFRRVTLIQNDELPIRRPAEEIARRIREVLSNHLPTTIAVPGWSDPAALAALGWGLDNGVPCIVMSESTAFDEPRSIWKEWLKSRVVRLCAAGLAGGTPHAEYLHALGLPHSRSFTGYDAVDNDYFSFGAKIAREDQASERARLGVPEFYFLASARFVEQKNLPMLLKGFAAYYHSGGENAWKLVLLGDGPFRAELEELRRSLDLTDAVVIPGFKQYDVLPAYYGLAGAFVHASTREPWGLVVNEAMAAGLPVVVSNRCGCARDLIVNGKNGFVFNPFNPVELSEMMRRIAAASPEFLAALGAASQRIIETWSPAHFAENLLLAAEAAITLPQRRASAMDRLLLKGLIWQANAHACSLLPMSA